MYCVADLVSYKYPVEGEAYDSPQIVYMADLFKITFYFSSILFDLYKW